MFLALIPSLLFIGQVDPPRIPVDQLRELIRTKSAPLKSLVFIFDGRSRFVGDPQDASGNPRTYDHDMNGTFLYRSDRSALCDVYATNFSSGKVVRKRTSILRFQMEAADDLLDAKQKLEPYEIQKYRGSLTTLQPRYAPIDLFLVWDLETVLDELVHEAEVEGWDMVDGRNCLRIRVCTFFKMDRTEDSDRERDKRFYWLDLERNAQVLREEYYSHGNLAARIDQVRLVERQLEDKTTYWLPVASRRQGFRMGGPEERYSKEPVYEQTFAVVAGSEQFNLNLPDSLFSVLRDAAYPTPKELASIAARVDAGELARKFKQQEPPPPYRTDPVSVRRRIEDGLAEANRQSKELEASSPARETWSGTTLIQVGVGVVGVALLGFVAVRKWRGE